MAKCPNCGQPTARTEDWACQHCGYPILYGPFQKIAKKYEELKAETRHAPQAPPPEIKQPSLPYSQAVAHATPMVAPVKETERELPPSPPPAPVAAVSPPFRPEPPPIREVLPAPVAAVSPPFRPEPPPILEPTTEGLDVEKLFAILSQNYAAALEKYQDKVLKVKGLVYRTVISDAIDINYLLLTSDKEFGQKQISCTFSKQHEETLTRLRSGETVMVEGSMRIKYDGTRFSILMKGCTLYR